ncbi:MAG: hypothetical protein J6S57_00495, partial [Alphaproteobacteria bacterium]|nr:hypothetical protein [Alphaproteobacteria bacterium]
MTQLLKENQLMMQEIQQKQFMMMGGIINKKQKVLSIETIKQIEKNYREMYFAFVSIKSSRELLTFIKSVYPLSIHILLNPTKNSLYKY